MRGSIGVPTVYHGTIIPHLWKLAKIVSLSHEGKKRLRWIDYYFKKKNGRQTCRHFDISPSLFYKWYNRFKRFGVKGLESRSRKPNNFRQREIPLETQDLIAKIRRENPTWSKYKVAHILLRDHGIKISSSSVNRIFHDRRLFFKHQSLKAQQAAKRAWRIKRLRAPFDLRGSSPGGLIEIDLKVLNVIGRTFYQFTAIDTCAKIKFIEIYSSKTAKCGERFVKEMINFYPFKIENINSDNGGEFLAECHQLLERREINHYFSRAKTPKDNPMVENTIKADKYEFWIWGNLVSNTKGLNQRAKEWMNKFNNYRPHQALNYMTPMEYYEKNFKS